MKMRMELNVALLSWFVVTIRKVETGNVGQVDLGKEQKGGGLLYVGRLLVKCRRRHVIVINTAFVHGGFTIMTYLIIHIGYYYLVC